MTEQEEKLDDRSYYLFPRRMQMMFAVITELAYTDYLSTLQIMEKTGYSRPYITALLTSLKKAGLIGHSKGGYYFVKGLGGTYIGDLIDAAFKDEVRTKLTREIYRYIIDCTNELSIHELMETLEATSPV